MSSLLEHADVPTAVFATTDMAAIGAVEAVLERGLRVPEDVAVVGFDDIPLAELLVVPLTTVAQPQYEMGTTAMRQLIKHLEQGSPATAERIVMPVELVLRRSTGAPEPRIGALPPHEEPALVG